MAATATTVRLTLDELRADIVGIDTRVPLLSGEETPYVFLDNAASTPTFGRVLKAVNEFMPWYSGVHRGTGFKSLLATAAFDNAHDAVARFVGADQATNTVIFAKNTTECVNKLSNRFGFRPGDVVLTTITEHHSNDLPWRKNAAVIHVGVTADGRVDMQALREAVRRHAASLRLVAVNGASNISGLCPPIHEIARMAHEVGARIFVDAAQLAPHRPISVLPDADPGHIDFLALSAHKMYAPFGTGALIGPKEFFREGAPDVVGGGVVEVVSLEDAVWNDPPFKEEAGSPNVPGGIALGAAISILESVGMDAIAAHETELLAFAYDRLSGIPGLVLYGPTRDISDKVGVISFNVEGMPHALVAAILGAESGVGVRNGCFCAHPFVKRLLNVSPEDDRILTAEVLAGDKSRLPGMVRASLGCYNTEEDVEKLASALERIVRREFRGTYDLDRASGAYTPRGYQPRFERYFAHMPAEAPLRRDHSEAS